jgi:rare lipoprotein A
MATTTPAPGGAKVGQPYEVNGRQYTPREQPRYDEVGMASWYGDAFQLRPTANGEIFDMNTVSAAHTTLPLPSLVEVTNLDNGRKLIVRVNDRGPFVDDRIIDLSREAARELGFEHQGLARVRVRYVGPAPLLGPDAGVRVASARPRRSGPVYASRATGASQAVFTSAPAPAATRNLQILPSMPARSPAAVRSASSKSAAPAGGYRIQAAAFSQQANAQRAVSRLAGVGQAVIEPMQRGGTTVYRVMLDGPTDELEAFGLREKVAAAGFEDAIVVRPY